MHGLALILTTACLGVDFGWEQQGEQLDYLIQLEPALLEQLKGGELVFNDIPEEVRGGRRFVLRVGTGEVPRRGRQVVPVAGGFQAGAEGVPQVARPAVIRAPGVVANQPVEWAMNPFNGWGQPAPLQPAPFQPAPGNFVAGGAVPLAPADPRLAGPVANDPRLIPLPAAGNAQPDPRVIPVADNTLPPVPGFGPPEMAAARLPVRPPLVDPAGANPVANNPPLNPPLNPPINPPVVNPPFNPPLNPLNDVGGNWNGPPLNPPQNPPFNNPPFNQPNQPQNPVRDPWNVANDPWANRNPAPPLNPANGPWNGNGNNGNGAGNNGNWNPAGNGAPWRDNGVASRDPQGQPRWDNVRPGNQGYGPGYVPGYGTPISYMDSEPRGGLAKAAAVVKEARITNTAAAATAARASPVLTVKADPDANKPWWPLMLTAAGFFLSIGGNMYLWWTWWDSHRRYLSLIGELRTARSS